MPFYRLGFFFRKFTSSFIIFKSGIRHFQACCLWDWHLPSLNKYTVILLTFENCSIFQSGIRHFQDCFLNTWYFWGWRLIVYLKTHLISLQKISVSVIVTFIFEPLQHFVILAHANITFSSESFLCDILQYATFFSFSLFPGLPKAWHLISLEVHFDLQYHTIFMAYIFSETFLFPFLWLYIWSYQFDLKTYPTFLQKISVSVIMIFIFEPLQHYFSLGPCKHFQAWTGI